MNSNTLRYIAAGAYALVSILGILGKITPSQSTEILAALIAAYHIAQGQLTPATNAQTPNNTPPKPSIP